MDRETVLFREESDDRLRDTLNAVLDGLGATLVDQSWVIGSQVIENWEADLAGERLVVKGGPSPVWDAFDDSLFEGIRTNPHGRSAILWPNAHELALGAPAELAHACDVLGRVSSLLSSPTVTAGPMKTLVVVIEVR